MSRSGSGDGGPDWQVPAVRCGLEVALLSLSVVYLYLHAGSPLLQGALLVVGFVGSVAIVMWYVNRLSLAWVRYASTLARRRRRRRERQRRDRQRERREQRERSEQ